MSMPTQNKLFKVTIPWAHNDAEQGDFCENTWAKDEDEAIRNVATSMANSYFEDDDADDEEEPDDKDFNEKIDEYVGNAGPYAAIDVAYAVVSDIRDLLAGPSGQFSPGDDISYRLICDLLKIKGT